MVRAKLAFEKVLRSGYKALTGYKCSYVKITEGLLKMFNLLKKIVNQRWRAFSASDPTPFCRQIAWGC
jgi:hypothetical protein